MLNLLHTWLARQVGLYVMCEFSFVVKEHQSMLDRFMIDLILDPERRKP